MDKTEAKAALDAAIQDYVVAAWAVDEIDSGHVADYYLIIASESLDRPESTTYTYVSGPGSNRSAHITTGLGQMGVAWAVMPADTD